MNEAHLEKRLEQIDKIYDDVHEIIQVLKGYDGQLGLVKRVGSNTKQINKLWLALAVLACSTGGGAFAIVRAIMGS